MPVITVINQNRIIPCPTGSNLMQVLRDSNVFLESPCSGLGTCGKCRVQIISGTLADPSPDEKRHLSADDLARGIRLSCMVQVMNDMSIKLQTHSKTPPVLTDGYLPDFYPDRLSDGFGIAVDLGTTTIAMSLVDLHSGREIGHTSAINGQHCYGLDVLSRINWECMHGEEGIYELQSAVIDSINHMLDDLYRQFNILKTQINEIVISANCTMTHMLLGEDARGIGKAPYQPIFLSSQTRNAHQIGLNTGENTILYCLPQVSSYIGGDIVAGICACQLKQFAGNRLFLDIGTNGELVLSCNGKLISCSCAAGPALEGMNIQCGMRAAEGAIEDIQIQQGEVSLQTIQNSSPVGLCGSGILAAVRELNRNHYIKKNGAFLSPEALPDQDPRRKILHFIQKKKEVVLCHDPEIVITQNDIRQVQLAKGAILSGVTSLLNYAGISPDKLDEVIVAGQFGSHLPASSLTGTGLLPQELEDKIRYVGNTSKTGAYLALLSSSKRTEMETLAHEMEYLELSQMPNYQEIFLESLQFPQ